MKGKEIRIVSLLVLDTVFFLLEAIIGYSVHSLALIADSFHMLNDIISLIIALWAVRVKNTKPADGKYTYGWQRAEILGALINAVFLLALCFTIIMDAIQRFFEPQVITNAQLILVVGIAGLLSNGVGLVLFHEHGHSHSHGGLEADSKSHSHSHLSGGDETHQDEEQAVGHANENTPLVSNEIRTSPSEVFDYLPDSVVERYHSHSHADEDDHDNDATPAANLSPKKKAKRKSMNMEGVFLHVLGDALGNVGVIITALVIWKTDYSWRFYADPVTSLVITLIILNSALPLVRKALRILLQSAPPNIDSNIIAREITKIPLIKSIHDFHVWNLNEDILIATLHIELNPNCEISLPPLSQNGKGSDTNGVSSLDTAVDEREFEFPAQLDKKLFLAAVGQVRGVLHRFGIDSVTIQPEFQSSDPCRLLFN
ncbi:Zinc/cadmium resistance protein [Candida viswanathii]|uniref:Zinc/cadmium resistance protein n=1 Tax=Candida viswanathii TaxID=5486 RepID=A0A367XPB2_9ASCO|nr:Zinc/cadmium resistance protein [Candida viswanathii]RCK54616.1 Zinc/cadmium resistance protein [Candida viswanathii]